MKLHVSVGIGLEKHALCLFTEKSFCQVFSDIHFFIVPLLAALNVKFKFGTVALFHPRVCERSSFEAKVRLTFPTVQKCQ